MECHQTRNWRMNSSISYVSRNNSTWIKGVLTILIILGHNMVFTIPLNDYGVMSYLYTFHIQGFFILPFLYGIKNEKYTFHAAVNTVTRFYWPYLILVTIFMIGYGSLTNFSNGNLENILELYILCSGNAIKQMCGIQIFWFLPAMMSLVFLKELFYRNGAAVKISLFILSILYIGGSICSNTSYENKDIWRHAVSFIPFGGGYALQMLAPGIILRQITENIEYRQWYKRSFIISIICFLIGTALYFKYVAFTIGKSDLNIVYAALQNIMPVIFIIMLLSALQYIKISSGNVLIKIGEKSLYIYLISPFIGYMFFFICQYFEILYWWVGVLIWPLITFISYYAAKLLVRGNIERIIFPHDRDAFINIWRKCRISK